MSGNNDGISEVIDEILLIAIIIVVGIVVFLVAFSVVIPIQKSAYVASDVSIRNVSGYSAIALFDRGGDPIYFDNSALAPYKAALYVDTPHGTYQAVPAPSLSVMKPGDTVYIYYTGSGFGVTGSLSDVTYTSLPEGRLVVRLVDPASNTLISHKEVSSGGMTTIAATTVIPTNITPNITPIITTTIPTANATVTITQTANVTATATPNSTTTTTVSTTVTQTTTTSSSTRTVTVRWSPSSYGYGSLSPPIKLTNSQEVRVPRGGSQTFYFVPNANKAVLKIRLDGTTVYSGSSAGTTISYTVSNVVEDRELTATFE